MRKNFTAGKQIESARAYIAGLGYYKLYLNGKRVGDHELDPAFTVYDKTVLYATYDVTKALQAGNNALGVSLGRGHYAMTKPDEWNASAWHSEPKLKLELDITYRDGSSQPGGQRRRLEGCRRADAHRVPMVRRELRRTAGAAGWERPGLRCLPAGRPALAVTAPQGTLRAAGLPAEKVTHSLPVLHVTTPSAASGL